MKALDKHKHKLAIAFIITGSIIGCWTEPHININQKTVNIIGTLSAIGSLTIAYFAWRAYTTVFQTKASEAQFKKVVNIINNLYKIKVDINEKGKLAIIGFSESSTTARSRP